MLLSNCFYIQVATQKYAQNYWDERHNIFVPPSITDPMVDSSYADENGRDRMPAPGAEPDEYGYDEPDKMAELYALYYGLVEEVDAWFGKVLDRLDALEIANNTLVVFTSDHGDQLGMFTFAHVFTTCFRQI